VRNGRRAAPHATAPAACTRRDRRQAPGRAPGPRSV